MADTKYNMFRNSICSAVTSSIYNGWTDSDLDSLSSSERTIYYDSNIAFTSGDKSIVSGTSGDGSLLAVPDLYGTLRGLNTRINTHDHNDEYASVSHKHDDDYAEKGHAHNQLKRVNTLFQIDDSSDSTIGTTYAYLLNPTMSDIFTFIIGQSCNTKKCMTMRFIYDATNPSLSFGFWGNDDILKIYNDKKAEFRGALTVNNILRVNSNDYTLASFFNPNMSTDDINSGNIYFGKSGSNNEGAFLSYSIDTNEIGIGVRGLGTRMFIGTTNRLNGNTAISGNLTADGLDIGKFSIKTQGDTWASLKMNGSDWIGLNTETNNISVYKNLSMNGELRFNTVTVKDTGGRLNLTKGIEMLSGTDTDTKLLLGRTNSSKQCTVMTYSHSDVPQFKIGFWDNNGDDIIINTNKELTIKDATTIDSNLTVAGKLNGFKIGTVNNGGNYMANTFIPTVTGDGVMEVGKHIDFHAYSSATETNDYSVRLSAASNNLSCSGSFTINGGNRLTLTGYIEENGYGSVADIGHLRIANSRKGDNTTYFRMASDNETNLMTLNPNGVTVNSGLAVQGNLTVTGTINGKSSQTISHRTNVTGEIGTFCETNGEIYDGYESIDQTDCICQVVQSTTLNPKIVGIITDCENFASHGDCLVKVIPGDYQLGDILCPDESGFCRVATEQDLMFMMLHAIPRPKITSLNTGIDGMVACFLV